MLKHEGLKQDWYASMKNEIIKILKQDHTTSHEKKISSTGSFFLTKGHLKSTYNTYPISDKLTKIYKRAGW